MLLFGGMVILREGAREWGWTWKSGVRDWWEGDNKRKLLAWLLGWREDYGMG